MAYCEVYFYRLSLKSLDFLSKILICLKEQQSKDNYTITREQSKMCEINLMQVYQLCICFGLKCDEPVIVIGEFTMDKSGQFVTLKQ